MENVLWLVLPLCLWAFWFDSLRTREIALNAIRNSCRNARVQLLDDTLFVRKLRLARGVAGHVQLRRYYRFEFSSEGNDRRPGYAILQGRRVENIWLEQAEGKTLQAQASTVEAENNVIKLPSQPK